MNMLLQSLTGTCRYCGQKAGFLRKQHSPCRDLHTTGIQEMVQLAAQAAGAHTFNEGTLRQTLGAIAQRSRATGEDIDRALEEGFRQGVVQAMSDGILTRQEEERLRTFRDNLALEDSSADSKTLATLDRASSDRLIMGARLAAISVHDGDHHLQDLSAAIRQAGLDPDETNRLLIRAWEAAVEGTLENGLVSLDEESAPAKYASHFSLTQQDLDGNGAQTSLVQAAVIRDVTQGIVPQRQNITGTIPFNLMKSEQLVWVLQDVDCLETVVRRERRGSSHGLSIGSPAGSTTGPAPLGAVPSSGRKPSTPIPDSWASPPNTSTTPTAHGRNRKASGVPGKSRTTRANGPAPAVRMSGQADAPVRSNGTALEKRRFPENWSRPASYTPVQDGPGRRGNGPVPRTCCRRGPAGHQGRRGNTETQHSGLQALHQVERRRIQAAAAADLGDGYTRHSGRVGMAQNLAKTRAELPALMITGLWKISTMPARYTNRQSANRGAVARYYQGRFR